MASETGHAKNVANLQAMISAVESFGATYNPPRTDMKIPALAVLYPAARDRLASVTNLVNEKSVAVRRREEAFADLPKLVTRVINVLSLTGAEPSIGERAREIARKLQGRRAGERIEDDPSTPDIDESEQNNSVSQMSYDNQLANFDALVQLLESATAYNPNETDLTATALRARLEAMRETNTDFLTADNALDAARAERDQLLYAPDTGLVDIAEDIKKYVKHVFGTGSPQYAQIKNLKFTEPR